MRIVVDKMPENSRQCYFGEMVGYTIKTFCMLQRRMYTTCALEDDKQCRYLVDLETLEKEKKIRELNEELDCLRELIEDGCISGQDMIRTAEITTLLSELEGEKYAT